MRIRFVLYGLLCTGVLLGAPRQVQSQQRTNATSLTVETVLSSRSFPREAPSLSPTGEWLAYTVQRPSEHTGSIGGYDFLQKTGAPKWLAGADVWITNTNTGESVNITAGKGTNWAPVWSPNGRYIAFYSDRDGAVNLWVFDVFQSSIVKVSKAVLQPFDEDERVVWTKDSQSILTKLIPEGPETSPTVSVSGEVNVHQASSAVMYEYFKSSETARADQRVPAITGDPYKELEKADLAFIALRDGRVHRVVNGRSPVWFELSPDNRYLGFASEDGLVEGDVTRVQFHLGIIDLATRRDVLGFDFDQTSSHQIYASWSPDATKLSLVINSIRDGESSVHVHVMSVIDRTTKEITPSAGKWAYWAVKPLWSRDSEAVYVLAHDDVSQQKSTVWQLSVQQQSSKRIATMSDHKIDTIVAGQSTSVPLAGSGGNDLILSTTDIRTKKCGFYSIDLSTGSVNRLIEEDKQYGPDQALSTFSSEDGQHIVVMEQSVGDPPEYWIISVPLYHQQRLTRINDLFRGYSMGKSRLVEWRGLDGETLRGALLLPANYQEGHKYPLIVWIYGGLNASDCLNYFGFWPWDSMDNMQLFATRGYAVLFADSRVTPGSPMSSVATSVLPGVNEVIDLGYADPDKIGVMGESFGGYSTLALLVQSPRFRAAVERAGPADLIGLYGEMDELGQSFGTGLLENGQGQMLGTLWQVRDRYVENSPLFYLDKVQTPLLILQGSNDTAVSAFLSDELFVAMRRLKKDVVYAKYRGEGHGLSGYRNRVDALNRELQWFDKYLMEANSDR